MTRTYVRATAFGVSKDGGKIRPGDKFWVEGPLGKWMEPVEGANDAPSPAPEPALPAEEPQDEPQTEAAADEVAEAKPARKRK